MTNPLPKGIQNFHAHLDVCKRCATQPFNLCTTGADLLKRAVQPEPRAPGPGAN